MRYFDDGTFAFLRDLRAHNDRAWFNENKTRYEEFVREPFLQFISDAGPELRKISRHLVADPRPVGGSMFRIHRDIRFSKDKSPYKPYVAAHFPVGRGMGGPGYYVHLEPGASIVAGGMWHPEAAALERIRRRISERPADWRKARRSLDDDGEALKRAPRGFSPDDPMVEDIKRRSFTSSTRLTDEQVLRSDVMRTFIRDCERVSPLMAFLSSAVGAPW